MSEESTTTITSSTTAEVEETTTDNNKQTIVESIKQAMAEKMLNGTYDAQGEEEQNYNEIHKDDDEDDEEDEDDETPVYEITATDHINASLMESFKNKFESGDLQQRDDEIIDNGEWDD
ncbi:hypothetical protein DFA_10643 [Cavenderia fasciculata]|uniref:Uncharacterized protein n=1 Tax=Cavenderia fasciculata TaxID=261658 RepID=F4QAZ8_CACFS|nr:uncharacterized protein DFA_10643 [Cavenderia fasciculata]EGG14770.1 hypothetical protein DFA_10643 [Cavenderia fasciculata]|eukprot:XP_004351286.1 hypothetical protein DFA_10643 [Cavenderia fasciculata]